VQLRNSGELPKWAAQTKSSFDADYANTQADCSQGYQRILWITGRAMMDGYYPETVIRRSPYYPNGGCATNMSGKNVVGFSRGQQMSTKLSTNSLSINFP
jgi:hypothetical protein